MPAVDHDPDAAGSQLAQRVGRCRNSALQPDQDHTPALARSAPGHWPEGGSRSDGGLPFTAEESEDLDLLVAVANQISVAAQNAQPHRDVLKQNELERELQFARQVMQRFCPSGRRAFPAMNSGIVMSRPGKWEETTMASSRCTRLTTPTADPCGGGPSQSATWWAKGCPLRSLPPSFPRRYGSFFKARPTRPGWSHGSIISSARTACWTCSSRSCWPCSTSPATDSRSSTPDTLVP